jgi:transposase
MTTIAILRRGNRTCNDVGQLVSGSRDYGINGLGPTRHDNGWQSRENKGFTSRDFIIDWEHHYAICPAGKTSLHWLPAFNNMAPQ